MKQKEELKKIRFFGSSLCWDCIKFFVILTKYDIDYDYIDTFDEDDEIQKLCDKYDVDKLPHIQFLENDTIIVEHIGPLDEEIFVEYLKKYFPDY